MGGASHSIASGRPHFGPRKRPGRLAQSRTDRPGGMAPSSGQLPGHCTTVRAASSRPLRHSSEHAPAQVLLPLPVRGGRGLQRTHFHVAGRPAIRVSPSTTHSPGGPEATAGTSGIATGGSSLAAQALVRGPGQSFGVASLDDSSSTGIPQSGGHTPSRSSVAPVDRLALERVLLRKDQVSVPVIQVMQSARRPSTTRIYQASWKAFATWCSAHHVDPTSASIPDVLDFLLDGLSKGLAPATLRRQVAALSTVLSCEPQRTLAQNPKIRIFLRGAVQISPPVVHRYPSWDLPLVLQALTAAPFEPLSSVPLKFLTFKLTFLLAVTSARRISELTALSVRKDLCIFHADRVVMRLDPSFTPKVNSWFHRAQEIILPDFCPEPRHPRERSWHALDVRRALRYYIDRTASFRQTEALLVSFHPSSMGRRVSSATVGRWIKACISLAYSSKALPLQGRIYAHSTRSAATTAAWSTQASVLDICRAATWASPSAFIRNYKIDSFASAEASFGRRVLQQVASFPGPGDSQPPTRDV